MVFHEAELFTCLVNTTIMGFCKFGFVSNTNKALKGTQGVCQNTKMKIKYGRKIADVPFFCIYVLM